MNTDALLERESIICENGAAVGFWKGNVSKCFKSPIICSTGIKSHCRVPMNCNLH